MTPVLFCADVFDSSCPHPMWDGEVKTAANIGEIYLLDHEALMEGKVSRALRRLPTAMESECTRIIYHGWMLTPEVYANLYNGLLSKGFQLINNVNEYLGCHYIANWCDVIKSFTPKTRIVHSTDLESIVKVMGDFGSSPIFIKDYVKSQKHSWKEACFIPDGSDIESVKRVISNFISLQKEYGGVQGGVVLREFVPLRSIGIHPKSKMPLSQEFRAFVLDGKMISLSQYWEYGDYFDDMPPMSLIESVSKLVCEKIGSNFFTIDVAQKEDGNWICIEIGDGQVSSLPDKGDKQEFYTRLMQ